MSFAIVSLFSPKNRFRLYFLVNEYMRVKFEKKWNRTTWCQALLQFYLTLFYMLKRLTRDKSQLHTKKSFMTILQETGHWVLTKFFFNVLVKCSSFLTRDSNLTYLSLRYNYAFFSRLGKHLGRLNVNNVIFYLI